MNDARDRKNNRIMFGVKIETKYLLSFVEYLGKY